MNLQNEPMHRQLMYYYHDGNRRYYSEEEFRQMAPEEADEILQDFGSWKKACEYLASLGMKLNDYVDMDRDLHANIRHLNELNTAMDFSNMPSAKEVLLVAIEEFYMQKGFVPTVDQAMKEYSEFFPHARHYYSTFGTWENACNAVETIDKKDIPTFNTELKTTVNYYNKTYGKTPGMLMTAKSWDKMAQMSDKNIPSVKELQQYSYVDIKSSDSMAPKNSWQAVAEAADLDSDRRGRHKEFVQLKDADDILKRYANACVKSGQFLTHTEWKDYCKSTEKSYRPPSMTEIKMLFGSIKHLRDDVRSVIEQNKRALQKMQENNIKLDADKQVAATSEQRSSNTIWDKLKNMTHSVDMNTELSHNR